MPQPGRHQSDERRRQNRAVADANARNIGRHSRVGRISAGHRCDGICGQAAENHYAVDDCADRFAGRINAVRARRRNGLQALGHRSRVCVHRECVRVLSSGVCADIRMIEV